MAVFIEGAIGILVVYVAILGVGIWASSKMQGESEAETMNAGGRFGLFIGTATLVGTWAGGSYIVGSAEKMYDRGFLEVQAPIGYSFALLLGALLFIRPMRNGKYITMLDLFQVKYGEKYGASLIIPALCGEFFWIASVLNSLGSALKVVLELEMYICILFSAAFAGFYTLCGGLTSVSYTDVAQLFLIVIGLIFVCPFAYVSEFAQNPVEPKRWVGEIPPVSSLGGFMDEYFLICFGGIPWQGYFQRIFSIRTTEIALRMSYISTVMMFIVAVPALFVGAVAQKTNWTAVEGWERELKEEDYVLVLPLVLRYLTPKWVAFLGLGAISGAVMSSADSAILASSALFSRNIYKHLLRPNASDRELHNCLRVSICLVTSLAAVLAVYIRKIYYLSVMCSDIVYVTLFPQLLVSLYMKQSNGYGSLAAYVYSIVFRFLAGEKYLGLPSITKYPMYDEKEKKQHFPFRTYIMITATVLMVLISLLAKYLFITKQLLGFKYDFLNAFPDIHPDPTPTSRLNTLTIEPQEEKKEKKRETKDEKQEKKDEKHEKKEEKPSPNR